MTESRAVLDAKLRLLDAAGRAQSAVDARDRDAETRWAAEAGEARIQLCEALGDTEAAAYWRDRAS